MLCGLAQFGRAFELYVPRQQLVDAIDLVGDALEHALNDTIMVFAFAPLVGLLLGISAITVPWNTLITSVVLYIVVPVIIAQILRRQLISKGGAASNATMARLGPSPSRHS